MRIFIFFISSSIHHLFMELEIQRRMCKYKSTLTMKYNNHLSIKQH